MKKETLRLVAGILAIIVIVYLWTTKDAASVYSSMPKEELIPMVVTGIAASALKVVVIAVIVLLLRKLIAKVKK